MLHAVFVGSPYPHARVVHVDADEAKAMPGVRAVLVGRDVKPRRFGRRVQDWPILAWDRVRFTGDRVAAVAADTSAQAEAAAGLIRVTYEELPPVFEPEEALRRDAPILHPERATYNIVAVEAEPLKFGASTPHPNMTGRLFHEHGDLAAGFARATRIFEHEYDVQRIAHGYIEPRASLVWIEGEQVHVVSTNRRPFPLRTQMARSLDIPVEQISVEPITIGGDFGGKALSIDEYALYLLSCATGLPVRSVMKYSDELGISGTRRSAHITLRTGIDAEGRITAHEARIVYDCGAYAVGASNNAGIPPHLETLIGYRVPAARIEAIGVYTNTLPGGAMRAPGRPQAVFAGESEMDRIARELGQDPLRFRELNVAQTGDLTVMGTESSGSELPAIIAKLRQASHWETPLPPNHGRGVALNLHQLRAGQYPISVRLTLRPDASLEVLTGLPEQGTGSYTVMQRVVAIELGITTDRVAVRQGGTWEVEEDPGHGGSRSTVFHGGAALDAARRLKSALASWQSNWTLERAARELAPLTVVGLAPTSARDDGAWGQAVEVSVDPDSGAFRIENVVIAADVGTVISPLALRGSLEGGFVMGLGQAIMEQVAIDDGHVVTTSLAEYKLPTSADVPPIHVVLHTSESGPGPYGAKAAGELANPGPGAAVANAIADAVGARLTSLPITAEKVRMAMQAQRSEAAARG